MEIDDRRCSVCFLRDRCYEEKISSVRHRTTIIEIMRSIKVVYLAMRLLLLIAAVSSCCSNVHESTADDSQSKKKRQLEKRAPPHVTPNPPNLWLPQSIVGTEEWNAMEWKPVIGCCSRRPVASANSDDEKCDDDNDQGDFILEPVEIGKMPQLSTNMALQVLDEAVAAWDGGFGKGWPQLTFGQRFSLLENFLLELTKSREQIGEILMWEIGKNYLDALNEFDRTLDFARAALDAAKNEPEFSGQAPATADGGSSSSPWFSTSSTRAFLRRAALGIVLCLGPFNYPLNETYAALIPALLMGNICILKIPTTGGLVHLLTLQAFQKALPPGTIHFIAGSGRTTLPPLMKTGKINALAFIGGSHAADDLIQNHPNPHRLKVFLQLEANNMGVYLPDLFDKSSTTTATTASLMLDHAVDQAVLGSLSYNGQRCTAIKLHMVPVAHAETFVQKLVERVEALPVGLPWQEHSAASSPATYSKITPLPTQQRIEYMQSLLEDALSKGATIRNKNGGMLIGVNQNSTGSTSTLMVPAVLYPVTPDMRVFNEEQFGPLVPVATYNDLEQDVMPLARDGPYAQQVAIFTAALNANTTTTSSSNYNVVASLVDRFALVFGRINLNTQCGRGPDTLPFTGRRSSAMGTMSVVDALREFSIPIVVSYNQVKPTDMIVNSQNEALAADLQRNAKFLQP
jgi:glyceraldehyde-3-phosphate dehydrogenase (NADP+)